MKKFEQQIILDAIEEQLSCEPNVETRNRKRLGENELSDWELRIDNYRVFYDVLIKDEEGIVQIKAVGHKEHNTLYIGACVSSVMKIIELKSGKLTLDEVMELAKSEAVVLRKADGELFALAPVDDFEVEVQLLRKNAEFMAFLKELSQEKATISLQSLRTEFGL